MNRGKFSTSKRDSFEEILEEESSSRISQKKSSQQQRNNVGKHFYKNIWRKFKGDLLKKVERGKRKEFGKGIKRNGLIERKDQTMILMKLTKMNCSVGKHKHKEISVDGFLQWLEKVPIVDNKTKLVEFFSSTQFDNYDDISANKYYLKITRKLFKKTLLNQT